MKKDFKIGLFLGLVLVSIAGIWICVSPMVSVKSRLGNLQKSKITPEAKNIKQEPAAIPAKPAVSESKSIQTSSIEKQIPEDKKTENIPTEAPTREQQIIDVQSRKEDVPRFHTIQKDETLTGIALKYYGAASKWTKIRDANPKVNPLNLKPGTNLIIPP